MATITKPILLDETGQDIVTKLEAIKNAMSPTSYSSLTNKPVLNNVEINGSKSLTDYGINIPTDLSQLSEDSTHRVVTDTEKTTWNSVVPTVLTGTLTAGQTTLTLSDASITTTSIFDIYTDTYGVSPYAMTVSTGSVTLTFSVQTNNVAVRMEVR